MKFRYDTYCGLYCGACELLNAFKDGRQEEQAKIWKVDAEDIRCYGCKSGDLSSWCNECEFKDCAISKNLEFCFECDDYPCQMLKDFQADNAVHHSSVFRGLDRIKEIGIEKWLTEQAERWRCERCGTPSTWYREKCEKCGTELVNCIKEEENL
ncbi:MAG: DUF3795 domain-containing protein [Candidatus Cloacimonetes bacterium]|nr:DUF3795 domain-containing protein [Candidatus Cloacimonadota bacterium]MCF7815318.1 DUF3795 domain-containing protein [Candidatus Cloacimonadota bacterium]MCF7869432.1 DUF3795 domain-containing protein [Candidatus Cloacimonadota bacterium]MCF7884821.1 DUF3795 domain-containing protein [Candidatus Cloacimonadota bacterium]